MDLLSLGAFMISLAIGLLLAFPLAKPLKRHPVVFYAFAFAIVGIYGYAVISGINLNAYRMVTFILQKGYLSVVLLAIVMFTGCFDLGSAIRTKLQPIRGELSVLSFIFILGHLIVFLPSYLSRIFAGTVLKGNAMASIVVAMVLMVIFVVLGVTSFNFIRTRMSPTGWKRLQRFAYVVVALLLVHIAFFMSTSAFGGSGKGLVSLLAYTVVIAAYAVMRIAKAVRDARAAGKTKVDDGPEKNAGQLEGQSA